MPVVVIDAMSLGMIPRCSVDCVIPQNMSMKERLDRVTSYSDSVTSSYGNNRNSKGVQGDPHSSPTNSAVAYHTQDSSINKSVYYAMGAIPKTLNQVVELKDTSQTISCASRGKSTVDYIPENMFRETSQTIVGASGGNTADDCIPQNDYEDKENGETLTLDATVSSQAMPRKSANYSHPDDVNF